MRKLLDNIFLWFLLGLLVFAVFYAIWGMVEIFQVPEMPDAVKSRILGT